jgi:hypothetical protein
MDHRAQQGWFRDDSDIAKSQIGERGLKRLRSLFHRLYGERGSQSLWFRAAPSIMTRSEAELYGVSSPRFAFRAYLRLDETGCDDAFANVRRLELLHQTARLHGGADVPNVQHLLETSKSSCIADCVLPVPDRLRRPGHHILEVELGFAYGEGRKISGLPFTNFIRLGGGLCAQANCFMATVLMQDYANGVHGIAEISALSSPDIMLNGGTIALDGMKDNRMAQYFALVGLNAVRQISFARPSLSWLEQKDWEYRYELDQALHSYLSSNIPLIVFVDVARLNGQGTAESVYRKNSIHIERQVEQPKGYPHCALLVGTLGHSHYVCHDPATFPFLELDLDNLIDASLLSRESRDRCSGGLQFQAILPHGVVLPLLEEPSLANSSFKDGLWDKMKAFQRGFAPNTQLPRFEGAHFTIGKVRLVHLDWLAEPQPRKILEFLPSEFLKAIRTMTDRVAGLRGWSWIQFREHSGNDAADRSCWLWRAEENSPLGWNPNPREHLFDVIVEQRGVLRALLNPDTSINEINEGFLGGAGDYPVPNPKPQVGCDAECTEPISLISSWMPTRFRHAMRHWPENVSIELYSFMQSDSEPIGKSLGLPPPFTAVDVLASLDERSDLVSQTCELISKNANQVGVHVVGIATYIPEISAEIGLKSSAAAVQALRAVGRISLELSRLGHPVRTIEVVAGSRIDTVSYQVRDGNKDQLSAVILSDAIAIDRFVKALQAALTPLHSRLLESQISLAIELEPGPLFIVRDWTTLQLLCAAIDSSPEWMSKLVGLNVDIPHWILAQDIMKDAEGRVMLQKVLTVDKVKQLSERIVHAHFSGHAKGHFGDAPPLDVGTMDEYLPWIRAVQEVFRSRDSAVSLRPSKRISLELEAARDTQVLQRAIDQMRSVLRRATFS